MPTIFSHAFVAAAVGRAAFDKTVARAILVLTGGCAMMPDADVIFAALIGAPRGSMFAHRGFTHSVCFAVLFGAIVAFAASKFVKPKVAYLRLFALFAFATFSHPLLDMLTDGGSGVALLAPFSSERFFFPFRPVEVSPIGLGFFTARGWTVIESEVLWLWLPSIVVLLAATFLRRGKK